MGNKAAKLNDLSPADFSELGSQTDFTQEELQSLYEDFKKEHPKGKLTRVDFSRVYTRFFPKGDPTKFTEHIFQNFDADRDGTIDFRELMCGMSILMRGTADQKLCWIFSLFDVDKSGFISKSEMIQILMAIGRMQDSSPKWGPIVQCSAESRTERIFTNADSDMDGELSFREFAIAAKKDRNMIAMLGMF